MLLTGGSVVFADAEIVFVNVVVIVALYAAERQAVALVHIAMQGVRAFLAGGDRVDDEARAGVNVTAHKDVGFGGLVGPAVGLCIAFLIQRDLAAFQQPAPVGGLTDRAEDGVHTERLEFAGADGLSSALLVRLAERHALDLQAADRAVRPEDLHRGAEIAEGHALGLRLGGLLLVGGHFLLAAAVDDGHFLRAETHCRTADVHGHVAAADDGDTPADGGFSALVELAQEVDAALHTGELLAGDAQFGRLLRADGDIKALVPLLAQLRDRHVFADVHAAANFHAQLPQHVDLGLHDVLFQSEGRDSRDHHAAGLLIPFKHGHIVAEHGEIVRAAQTRGTGADHGDPVAVVKELLRHETVFGLQLAAGDEFFHLVDRDGLVNIAARADLLAEAGTDVAADGGEGIFLLDELQRLEILALARFFQITLYGDVCRTVRLAGGGAGLRDDVFALGEKIRLPVRFAEEDLVVRNHGLRDPDGIFLTELLPELHGVLRTDLHAAAAGDAVGGVDLGDVVRAGEAGRLGVPAGLERHAGVPLTVADEEREVRAVDVRQLMDGAPALGLQDDLLRLRAGDAAGFSGADAALGILAQIDAAVKFQIRRALADHAAQLAAFAGRDADAVSGLVQPVGDLLILHALRLVLDGLLHGDRPHERLPHRHGPRDLFLQLQYIVQEGRRGLGKRVRALLGHDGALHVAGGEHRQHYAVHAVIVAAVLQQADVHQIVRHLRCVLYGHALMPCQFVDVIWFAQLHLQREIHLLIRELAVIEDVFPALFAGHGIEHVDVPHEPDQILARRFAAFLPVCLQTFLFAFGKHVICHLACLP